MYQNKAKTKEESPTLQRKQESPIALEDNRGSMLFEDNRDSETLQRMVNKTAPRSGNSVQEEFKSIDISEAAQFKAKGIDYQVSYETALPQQVGIADTQNSFDDIAQLQEMGISGYSADSGRSVDTPIIQMVRTPEGIQAQMYTGSQVIVTQMISLGGIWDGIKEAGAVAKKYSTALLLAAESILTISAGIVGCTVNPFAGAGAIIIGILKGVRAFLSFLTVYRGKETEEDKIAAEQRKVWADRIRAIEAGLALLLAFVGLPNPAVSDWTKVTSTLFASVKSLRSLLILCGADKYTLGKKLINGLQLVEGASVLTGGIAMASASDATGAAEAMGGMGAAVGASKGVRGAEGMHEAYTGEQVDVDWEEIANSDAMQGLAAAGQMHHYGAI